MQANDQDFFSVAMVPAHLNVPEYQKEILNSWKNKEINQQEGCGILTGTDRLKIDGFYPANKADNNTEKLLYDTAHKLVLIRIFISDVFDFNDAQKLPFP